MDAAFQTINDFDNLLVKVIHDVLAYCLGEGNAEIIEKSMEKNGLPPKGNSSASRRVLRTAKKHGWFWKPTDYWTQQ